MVRWLLALLLAVSSAQAAPYRPCPYITIGWSQTWTGKPITSVSYDSSLMVLYVIWNNTFASAFSNVPLSVMQGFSKTQDPVGYYNMAVYPAFHSMLLTETDYCPLRNEAGQPPIWTK